jgi:hypothetical protein
MIDQETKRRPRVRMTQVQAATPAGRKLLEAILQTCHDGQIEYAEAEQVFACLKAVGDSIPAAGYLRVILMESLEDGSIDAHDAYRLKQAFIDVVPRESKPIIETHLQGIGLPAREAESHIDQPPWWPDPITGKQAHFIASLGGVVRPNMTKGEASVLIDQLLNRQPPTPRQIMLLRFFNRMDLADASREEISGFVAELQRADPDAMAYWDRFKLQAGIPKSHRDPLAVPIGAYAQMKAGKAFRAIDQRPVVARPGLVWLIFFGLLAFIVSMTIVGALLRA